MPPALSIATALVLPAQHGTRRPAPARQVWQQQPPHRVQLLPLLLGLPLQQESCSCLPERHTGIERKREGTTSARVARWRSSGALSPSSLRRRRRRVGDEYVVRVSAAASSARGRRVACPARAPARPRPRGRNKTANAPARRRSPAPSASSAPAQGCQARRRGAQARRGRAERRRAAGGEPHPRHVRLRIVRTSRVRVSSATRHHPRRHVIATARLGLLANRRRPPPRRSSCCRRGSLFVRAGRQRGPAEHRDVRLMHIGTSGTSLGDHPRA